MPKVPHLLVLVTLVEIMRNANQVKLLWNASIVRMEVATSRPNWRQSLRQNRTSSMLTPAHLGRGWVEAVAYLAPGAEDERVPVEGR